MLRGTLLYLADQPALKRVLGGSLARPLVRRFIAGEALPEAIENVHKLNAAGMTATLDYLGESVGTAAEASAAATQYIAILHAIERAGFTTRHLWVTPYDRGQRFPAGDYPNQHPGGDGLPAYAAADRPLENTDVVVWYVFGAHHIVRPEDWPVMPAQHIGFMLKPNGFFDGNPGLDVPMPEHCHVPDGAAHGEQ